MFVNLLIYGAGKAERVMMTRTQLREHIFKVLFLVEFHSKEELERQIRYYLEDIDNITEKDFDYIINKSMDIAANVEGIDADINTVSEGWPTNRLGKAELSILRLAVYEIEFDQDIPVSVAINEAVELAKKYGADNAPAFINGILAKFVKE